MLFEGSANSFLSGSFFPHWTIDLLFFYHLQLELSTYREIVQVALHEQLSNEVPHVQIHSRCGNVVIQIIKIKINWIGLDHFIFIFCIWDQFISSLWPRALPRFTDEACVRLPRKLFFQLDASLLSSTSVHSQHDSCQSLLFFAFHFEFYSIDSISISIPCKSISVHYRVIYQTARTSLFDSLR